MGSPSHVVRAIILGGLIAGTLDIADALIFHAARGVAPWRIPQAIASGLLGRQAFDGGAWTATLGLGLHFFIAASAAAVCNLASLRLPLLNPPTHHLRGRLWSRRVRRNAVHRAAALGVPPRPAGPGWHD
jgi:hypothetical protein